jgi:hypothetical protein
VSLDVQIDLEAHNDLGRLRGALLTEAYSLIVRPKADPLRWPLLSKHPEIGDLSDCRKAYFNGSAHRVVYQLRPDEAKPRLVYIVSVGARANLQVYRDAAMRLGRTPE